MCILVKFFIYSDMIECPDFIVNNLKSYQSGFMIKEMITTIGCIKMGLKRDVAIVEKHL